MSVNRKYLQLLILLIFPLFLGAGNENITTLPDSNQSTFRTQSRAYWKDELPAIYARYFPIGWVYSGGIHATVASMTSSAFSTEAFTSSGNRVTADSAGGSVAINYSTAGCAANDIAWIMISSSTGTTLGTFTRVGTSNYFVDCSSATIPTLPSNSAWLMKVTIAGSVVSVVTDLRVPASFVTHGVFDPSDHLYGASLYASGSANAIAIQLAINAAVAQNGELKLNYLYPITTLEVANGIRKISGPGGFQATSLSGTNSSVLNLATDVNTLIIDGVRFVMSTSGTGNKYAIYGACSSCVIVNNIMSSFEDINGHGGILLIASTQYTRIANNFISMVQPPLTVGHTASGIWLKGTGDALGGYFVGSGTCTAPTTTINNNTITGNVIYGGSHGILGRFASFNTISGNSIRYSWHRNMEFEFASDHNVFSGNSLSEYYSSALNLSYCSSHNTVSGNTAYSTVTNGQATFLAYIGTTDNVFANNNIKMVGGDGTSYGIYFAVGSSRNVVEGNKISGFHTAGIAIDSTWRAVPPVGAVYSKILEALPASGQWEYAASDANIIQNNFIEDRQGAGPSTAISLTAMGSLFGVTNTVVRGNHVKSTNNNHQFFVYEEDPAAPVSNISLKNNTWDGIFIMGARGLAHYVDVSGNYRLDTVVTYALVDGDTTPDVSIGANFSFANTAPTSVTFFDGGALAGREIQLRMDVNTTLVHDNAKIRLDGNVNFTNADSNTFIKLKYIGGIWYEIFRSRNFVTTKTQATLGAASNGQMYYCSDCVVTSGADNTCAAAGTGAFALRVNGAWRCFAVQN